MRFDGACKLGPRPCGGDGLEAGGFNGFLSHLEHTRQRREMCPVAMIPPLSHAGREPFSADARGAP
jgi:hypothetical protein